jgi:hypothetical protein
MPTKVTADGMTQNSLLLLGCVQFSEDEVDLPAVSCDRVHVTFHNYVVIDF